MLTKEELEAKVAKGEDLTEENLAGAMLDGTVLAAGDLGKALEDRLGAPRGLKKKAWPSCWS